MDTIAKLYLDLVDLKITNRGFHNARANRLLRAMLRVVSDEFSVIRYMSTFVRNMEYGTKISPPPKQWNDHAVPVNILHDELIADIFSGRRHDLTELISHNLFICRITDNENTTLDTLGLRSRMPEGWTWGDNPLARYEKAGIELVEISSYLKVWSRAKDTK